MRTIAELTEAGADRLAAKRVFFGHQSVGANIMDGVAELIRERPDLKLKVLDLDSARGAVGGFFAHARLGANGKPMTKTDDFARVIDGGQLSALDIAFHTYCYVDIVESSDIAALFAHYRETMARLRAAHPGVRFVHVTVPLTEVQSGPKAVVKKLLGRAPLGYLDNLRRERFNDMMRAEYSGREPVFNLAAVESTGPNGEAGTISFGGVSGKALLPMYTVDGGHLNELGRRRAAEELIVFLADLSLGDQRARAGTRASAGR